MRVEVLQLSKRIFEGFELVIFVYYYENHALGEISNSMEIAQMQKCSWIMHSAFCNVLSDQLQSGECQDSWDDSVVKTTAPSPLSFGEQLDQLHFYLHINSHCIASSATALR